MSSLEQLIWEKALPICQKNNLELLEVNYKKQKTGNVLEVIINKDDGVSIDDCTIVNEELNVILDELDPIPESYTLEVSSAGLEREIKSNEAFFKAIGKYIHIKTYEKLNIDKFQTKDIEGYLVDLNEKEAKLETLVKNKKTTIVIEREKIAKVRYAIKF